MFFISQGAWLSVFQVFTIICSVMKRPAIQCAFGARSLSLVVNLFYLSEKYVTLLYLQTFIVTVNAPLFFSSYLEFYVALHRPTMYFLLYTVGTFAPTLSYYKFLLETKKLPVGKPTGKIFGQNKTFWVTIIYFLDVRNQMLLVLLHHQRQLRR